MIETCHFQCFRSRLEGLGTLALVGVPPEQVNTSCVNIVGGVL